MVDKLMKKDCSGCHACASICPKKCISMKQDEEGFLYPVIDGEKCIKCGLCKNICPALTTEKDRKIAPKAYGCYNKDEGIRKKSSSGGIFSVLANYVLERGGVVFGAGFNDKCEVVHQEISNKENLDTLRMSKYVQSRIGDCYLKAKTRLDNNIPVLFTGTPCQIEGLKKFLKKDYENLITQDLICHGVPSPAITQKYLDHKSEQYKSKIKNVEFRNKSEGWHKFSFVINFEDGNTYKKNPYRDQLMNMFLFDKNLRPSCYDCKFKKISRVSDFTLADFWGIKDVAPELDDNKGTSLVLIHSQKGLNVFDQIKDQLVFKEVDFEKATKRNPMIKSSTKRHFRRAKIMKDFNSMEFRKFLRKYGKFMI